MDFLDEAGGGRVIRFLDQNTALVELEEGLEAPYPIEQLVKRAESEAIPYGRDESFHERIREKEAGRPSSSSKSFPPRNKLEIDLHIEELHERPLYLTNTEILHKQLAYCREKLQKAQRERIPRVIIIHGVGEGVLRNAVHDLLYREFPKLPFFDAPFREYGRGATEVRI